jgi:hypothetical protein
MNFDEWAEKEGFPVTSTQRPLWKECWEIAQRNSPLSLTESLSITLLRDCIKQPISEPLKNNIITFLKAYKEELPKDQELIIITKTEYDIMKHEIVVVKDYLTHIQRRLNGNS